MDRNQVETAIQQLDELLERDSDREARYQRWFESHPVVFVALGYQRWITHPRLRTSDGTEYIPDFMVQRANGTWEILELKTPDAKTLRDSARRYRFYASFEDYLSQCHDYAECLDEASTREGVERDYGINLLHKRPVSVLVAGRNEGVDLRKLYNLASRRAPPISIYTYDDIRSSLLSYRTFNFGSYDGAHGISIHATLMVHAPNKKPSKNHILDVGVHKNRDRIAIFIDPQGYLRLRVWDTHGQQHEARSSRALEVSDYEVPHWFMFEVGLNDDFGFISIQIDGRYHADIKLQNFPFKVSHEHVLGSDHKGEAPSWFSMYELVVLNRAVSFDEKMQLQRHASTKALGAYRLEFKGHKWMHTAGHPAAKHAMINER